jgi:tetratricopeptide (TPR) repeat protein
MGQRPAEGQAVPRSALPVPSSYAPRTLRHELKSRGRLPVDECLHLGLALTSALEHLHQNGLVHRDVKPSNLIFVNGQPKLADIGLVAGVDEARSFVGTEGYIPPEGPGKPQADLYSLGIVLYVMSTGKRHDAFPEPLEDLASDPDHQRWLELNAIIHKACHADPKQRYQTAGEMRADLELLRRGRSVRRKQWLAANWRRTRTVGAAVAAVGLVALALREWTVRSERQSGAGTAERASVFVLPFRHSVPIAERPIEYEAEQALCLCGRITDAFIDALPLIPGVPTGPRKSDWIRYDEDQVRHSLARTNNTRFLLTGRVDHTNDVLRLALRLYEREKDQPLWTETFAGTTNDVLALERRAITDLVSQLALPISDDAWHQIDRTLSNNLAAYGLFLQGRAYHMAGARIPYRKALDCFNRAVECDRNYVTAHVGYMQVQRELIYMRPPTEIWPVLARRAERILEIDDTCFVAQYRRASKLLAYDYDWERGIEAHDHLMSIWPERNLSWMVYYRILGRTNEARIYHERLKQEPDVDSYELEHLALGEAVWRNHEEAIRIARYMLEAGRGSPTFAQYDLGRCLLAAGQYPEAIAALRLSEPDWPTPETTGLLGRAYALMGDRTNAFDRLRQLEERERVDEADPYFLAWIHAALGSTNQALAYLNKAIDYRSEYITSSDFGGLRTDPAWDGLREDPRFDEICRRVGMGKGQWPK